MKLSRTQRWLFTSVFLFSIGCGTSQMSEAQRPKRAEFCDIHHVLAVVEAQAPKLRACYDQASSKNAKLASGRWVVGWTIMPDGRPHTKRTKVHRAVMQDAGLESCLVDVVNRLSFNQPRGVADSSTKTGCNIRMPFLFDDQGTPVLDAVKLPR